MVGDEGLIAIRSFPLDEPVRLAVIASGLEPSAVAGIGSELPHRIVLAKGASITGRMADRESGEPLNGATVSVDYWLSPGFAIARSMSTTTDKEGRWSVTGLPAGSAIARVVAEGFTPWTAKLDLTRGEARVLDPVELRRGLGVSVVVVDDLGAPVKGAGVSTQGGDSVQTDDDGVAQVSGVPPEGVEIKVQAPAHVSCERSIRPPYPNLVEINLTRAVRLTAIFVDDKGRPVEGAEVRLDTGDSSLFFEIGGDGRLTADVSPGVEFAATFRGPTTLEVGMPVPEGAPGERIDLGRVTALEGAAVMGTVLSAPTGAPIGDARLWTIRPTPQGPLIAWMQGDLIETRTGPDGRFRLGGLPPGLSTIRVDAPGYARQYLDVNAGGEAGGLDVGFVRVSPGSKVVVDVGSGATTGLMAFLDLRGEGLPADILTAPVTGESAVFGHVADGAYKIHVDRGPKTLCVESAEVSSNDGDTEVDCQVADTLVRGLVLVGHRAAGSGTLVWKSESGSDDLPEGISNITTPSGLRRQSLSIARPPDVSVPVDADGRFETKDVSVGDWQVRWFGGSGDASVPIGVTVPQGKDTVDVSLEFPSAEIEGIVIDAAGTPVADARVRELTSGGLAFSGADGEFSMPGLQPGPAEFQARSGRLESPVVTRVLEEGRPGARIVLRVSEQKENRITIGIQDEGGRPVPGALVFLQTSAGDDQVGSSGSTGEVEFQLLRPTPNQARAAAFAGGVWVLGEWESLESLNGQLTLEFGPSGGLRVVTDELSGFPAIVSQDGWDLSWMSTRVGHRPTVSPSSQLPFWGLPPGSYAVSLFGRNATATVRAGEETMVRIRGE